ncbi:MAG: nitronate monooxygenase [Novosphingobium sp.]
MSFASSVPLAVACREAGVLAGWQGGTVTRENAFRNYLDALGRVEGTPAIVNLPARIATERDGEAKLAMLEAARAPLVLSSVGNPAALVARVHGWGGRLIQDVTTFYHAEKSIDVGVDGLMATCAGAGGHTGFLTPMAFVPALRRIWDGFLIVAGGIADARGIAGALALGGDIACMGTRFIATPESGVVEGHRQDRAARHGPDHVIGGDEWRPSQLDTGLDRSRGPRRRYIAHCAHRHARRGQAMARHLQCRAKRRADRRGGAGGETGRTSR